MTNLIAIADFKAHLNEILDKAQKTNQEVIITRRGNKIARIIPIEEKEQILPLFGLFKDKAAINGDIVVSNDERWEAEDD